MRAPLGIILGILFSANSVVMAEENAASKEIAVTVTANTACLMPYQVFELTFNYGGPCDDPTWDAAIDVLFTSPSGTEFKTGGFFYGSSKPQKPIIKRGGERGRATAHWPCDPADVWKARYAPRVEGKWKYRYRFHVPGKKPAEGEGMFRVVRGRLRSKGWVRINPANPFRFVFEDGTPFFPVGFQDGVFDNNHNGSAMDAKSMEGPFRLDGAERRPDPPPGALFARGPSMNPVNADVYFGRHSRAGFNLWRFSPHNFSLPVFDINYGAATEKPGTIRWEQAVMVDEMLRMTRRYGIRNFYGIFGFAKAFNNEQDDKRGMEKVKRIIKYSVDRWGAFVDIWEILNEQKASKEWYEAVTAYLRSVDPYHKPIATSWERPELDGIDVNAPHWYGNEDELASDRVTAGRAERDKRFGKPVVYGEQGNNRGRRDRSAEGIGGVWDPGSARRMRVRLWTALFSEISLVFWETSYAKDGHFMNIWIGPEERQYVCALQDFAHRLDAGVKETAVSLAGPERRSVRAYGLCSEKVAALYLHHFRCEQCRKEGTEQHSWSHKRGVVRGLSVSLDVPQEATGYWCDPRTASILERFKAPKGRGRFPVPEFDIDCALLVTSAGAPDVDGDGKANDRDDDDDNDGVRDAADAFPLEREEWADADRDRIGDNFDADIDGDGRADDRNGNGIPDNRETDRDGDGIADADAIPWDAFPLDPADWRDSDGDGIGDTVDPDDDGDGYSDTEERKAGTDPRDPVSFPVPDASGGGA